MPTLASQLVQFLMSLFNNPHAVQAFLADPEQALSDAGLGSVGAADVHAAMPVVLDYAPIIVDGSSFDRVYHTDGNSAWTAHKAGSGTGGSGGAGSTPPPAGGGSGGHLDDHGHAVQQLQHVVNNYSYTSTVDDRDTITDQSVHQNVWADGDVRQFFDSDAIIASGGHAMAAGNDIDLDDSSNVKDSNNIDNWVDNSIDNSVTAGADATVGNTDVEVDVDRSFNTDNFSTDNSIDDSFNTDLDLDVAASLNDNSDNSDNSENWVDNSDNSVGIDADLQNVGNTDNSVNSYNFDNSDNSNNSVNTDVDLVVEDSFNDTADNSTNTDVAVADSFNPTEVEDTFVDNSYTSDSSTNTDVAIDEIDAQFTNIQDSNVIADHDVDVQTQITEAADGV